MISPNAWSSSIAAALLQKVDSPSSSNRDRPKFFVEQFGQGRIAFFLTFAPR
jgi:hypothetical protein